MRLPKIALLASILLAQLFPASSEEATLNKVTVASGQEVRLGYYAIFTKNCSVGPLPTIRLSEPAKHGVVRVRKARLRTKNVANCPIAEGPVDLVFYRASANYTGPDSVTYDVINPITGQTQSHAVAITVTGSI